MAQSTVELIVNAAKAINPLKRVTTETKKLEAAVSKAQNGIRNTNRGLGQTGKVANNAAKGVNKLGKAVRGLVAGFTAIQALKFVIFKTAELERQTKSLEVLTGSLGNARNIIKELQQFGAVTPFTSSELIETAKRLKAFGFETEQVVDVTKRLADVAGATGADLGGIATAFGQIQAKGRLQGEELLQLQERGVSLQDELQKMYGLTADEFRKALEGGRISADAVNIALQNITDTGGKYANGAIAQSETLAGKFSTLVDGIERIAVTIGNTLSPVLKFVLDDTTTVINSIVKMMNQAAIAGKVGLSENEQQRLFRQASSEAEETQRRRQGLPATGFAFGALNNEEFQRLRNERFDDLMRQEGFKRGTLKTPFSAPTLKGNTGIPDLLNRTTPRTTTQTGQTPEEKAAEALKQQQEAAQKLLVTKKQQLLLVNATSDEERDSLQHVINKFNLARQFPGLGEEELQVLRDQLDANFKATQLADVRLAQETELNKKLKEQEAQAKQLDDAFRNGIVDALTAAIDGTKSLSDSLVGVIRQMAKLILQQQLMNALSGFSFSSFFGFRANGGPVSAGSPYIVGERGPEMFVPSGSGKIVANDQLGGSTNVVVNVDASGTNVEGDEGSSRQLGALVGAAVQNELIKQQRPGGLLSR